MANKINNELELQNKMIEDLDTKTDKNKQIQ